MFQKILAGAAACALLAATAPAQAAVTIDHADLGGFRTDRDPGSAPVGRLTVSSDQTISGFGIDVDLNGDSDLTFLIFNSTTGAVLYQSAATSFTDTGEGYKYSDPFSFTFTTGITYGLTAWASNGGHYYVDETPNTVGAFSFLTGNQNVTYNTLNTDNYCCDVATSLVVGEVTGGVPEPATWTMMILGFGAIGATLRSSRRRMIAA